MALRRSRPVTALSPSRRRESRIHVRRRTAGGPCRERKEYATTSPGADSEPADRGTVPRQVERPTDSQRVATISRTDGAARRSVRTGVDTGDDRKGGVGRATGVHEIPGRRRHRRTESEPVATVASWPGHRVARAGWVTPVGEPAACPRRSAGGRRPAQEGPGPSRPVAVDLLRHHAQRRVGPEDSRRRRCRP